MARGFGNSPAGDMTLPEGNIPGITNVRYAGMVPYRNGVTNPPITTPQFPNNAPRATNKSPIALHPVVDNLTLTRPTHTMLGSIPAGGYRGAVGQVVRSTDQNVGAGLRGVMVSGRLGSHGFGNLGTTPVPVTVTAGGQTRIENVATFSLPSNPYVQATMEVDTLVLAGKKAGSVTFQYAAKAATPTGVAPAPTEVTVTVTGLTNSQALALADETWRKIKDIQASAAKPVLDMDWQDAEVLRSHYNELYPLVRQLFATARDLPGYRPQEYQARLMLKVLETAKANPGLQTLAEVVNKMNPGGIPASLGPHGRECSRNSQSGVVFHDLYTFAKGVDTATMVATVTAAAIALAAATIATLGAAAIVGAAVTAVAATVGAAVAAAAPFIPQYASDPKRLVANFGNAICAAASGSGALPARLHAAASLRAYIIQKAGPFQLARLIYNDPRTSATAKASALRALQNYAIEAQGRLVGLQNLDNPAFFAKNPVENAKFNTAKAMFSALNMAHPELSGPGDQTPPAGPTNQSTMGTRPDTTGSEADSGSGSGAGGDTDQPKASSNTPMLIGGAVVLGIGAFLLLRK